MHNFVPFVYFVVQKRFPLRLMLTFALMFVATGCPQGRYRIADLDLYVPEESAWCSNACDQQYNECLTSCPPQDMDCHCECRAPRRQCVLDCPGTIQRNVSPEMRGIAEVVCPPREGD